MIGVDIDLGELGRNALETFEGDNAILGRRIVVSVGFERTAPVDALGDSHSKKESRMSGEFSETLGRNKE